MLHSNFVIIGAFISITGNVAYIVETLKGNIKPNKVTFLLWSIVPFIAFFAQIKQGVGIQALFTFVSGFMPLLLFLASFVNKNAEWRITRFDLTYGFLALVGIVLWIITKVGNLAILFSILADALAVVPTVVKAYKFPNTELAWPWLTSGTGAVLTLLTIERWTFANSSFALYIVFICILMFVLVQFKIGQSEN